MATALLLNLKWLLYPFVSDSDAYVFQKASLSLYGNEFSVSESAVAIAIAVWKRGINEQLFCTRSVRIVDVELERRYKIL